MRFGQAFLGPVEREWLLLRVVDIAICAFRSWVAHDLPVALMAIGAMIGTSTRVSPTHSADVYAFAAHVHCGRPVMPRSARGNGLAGRTSAISPPTALLRSSDAEGR